jgi:hypothetical protein
LILFVLYSLTAPQNHSEAEDVYDFARRVEQGCFAEQAGVNRVLALPLLGAAYKTAQALGYSGRAFPFMIFINRMLAVVCVMLFWKLLSYRSRPASPDGGIRPSAGADGLLAMALTFAFSYGFWRYANEAETYVLASFLVLSSWILVLKGKVFWGVGVSALGILVHLLNLIPLLLIIPLYYLLSKEWKKALLHGGLTGVLVVVGYAACSPWLDFSELGAQNHLLEGGLSLANVLRGGIAFGQCLVSGNFLFGFESFCELLTRLFPSRMLGEEFYMAAHMPGWIKWTGVVSAVFLLCSGVWVCGRAALECAGKRRATPLSAQLDVGRHQDAQDSRRPRLRNSFFLSCLTWIVLYALAVIRTEAGSPELWIMALIPFWLLVAPLLRGRLAWLLVAALFAHNLIAGLLPVMAEKSDYHAAKGRWLVENCAADDLILTDYEPVMIFYLDYFTECRILNSGILTLNEIAKALEEPAGNVYALKSFFQPMESMRVRSPKGYERMRNTGQELLPGFEKTTDDAFGGIYRLRQDDLSE